MRISTLRTMTSSVALIGALAFAPSSAFAQDGASEGNADEIVVTAQRREEKSLDVPITVTSLSPSALETANVQDLGDIVKVTPGLRFDFAGGYTQPTIRGVGTSVVSSGAVGNVGIYIDGFYVPNPIVGDMQLLKVKSIGVVKGPQGTLFGRNTTGGAILVQTADPSTEPSGEVKFSYGRYNEFRAQAYGTFGIGEGLAMDLEGSYSRGDGFLTNISNNRRVGQFRNWSTRVGLKADLSDSISVLLRYQHNRVDDPTALLTASYRDAEAVPEQVYIHPVTSARIPFSITQNAVVPNGGAPFFAAPGQVTFDPDQVASGSQANDQQFFRSKSNIVQATIKADLGFANLTSYTQYRKEDADSRIEGDHSGAEVFDIGLPNDNSTFTQELLLTSKPGGALQWTAGLFYVKNRDTYRVYFDFAPNLLGPGIGPAGRCCEFGSSSTSQSIAAYVDATYELSPKFFITAGARYAHDSQSDVRSQAAFLANNTATQADLDSVKSNRVTPRAVLRYKPTDEMSIYASYSKGYKAGFLDLGGGTTNLAVKPETIDAYEVGVKFDNRRLSLEVAGFYYDYKDLQVSLYQSARAVIVNAANSKVYGLDAQLRYNVSDAFSFNIGATWVHARYKQFNNAPVYVPCLLTAFPDPNSACTNFDSTDVNPLVTPGVLPYNVGVAGQTWPIQGQQLTNVTMQRAPALSGNVGARYRTELSGGKLEISGNLAYTSKFFFGPSGIQFPQKGYETLSLRAAWTDPDDRVTVAVWGDNVTNSRYLTGVQYTNNGIGANWSKPATYGVEFGAKF